MAQIILVVDDDTTSLKLAKNILDQDYRVATVNSGPMVVKYLAKNRPDLILLDIDMPEMDGFSVMEQLTANPDYVDIPVIFLTANQDPATEARCFEAGAIDFVGKPFVPAVLKSRVKRTLELMTYRDQLETMVDRQAQTIAVRTERIGRIQEAVIIGMANLIELRDNSTGKHVGNTQNYVEMLCNALREKGLYENVLTDEYVANTIKAAPLHDVGKIRISDTILKKPARLTNEEYEEIKQHARIGGEIIDEILGDVEDEEYLKVARAIVLHHHERWDGKGYPDGLAGEDIPVCARIMALADVFDALYEDRYYKKGIRPLSASLAIIEDGAKDGQFDPAMTKVFLEMKDQLSEFLGEDKE